MKTSSPCFILLSSRQWSSCRSGSMCLVPNHFSWKDTNGFQVLGFVNPWRNPSRYDSLRRWLLQWKIPGHNKCTRWICNQLRVSLWYPAWPPFQVRNSCLAGNFLLEDTITSVVYVLLASRLCIRNGHKISRYKTFESRFTICLLVCLF